MTPLARPLAWIVGARGLLGSAVADALGQDAWRHEPPFPWGDPPRFAREARVAAGAFARRLAVDPGRPWAVAWCAGAGVVGTSAAALAAETADLASFLEALRAEPGLARGASHFLLASSAGGVYGGSLGSPLTDATPPAPLSDYGRAKLAQEELLARWAAARPAISTLVARLTNLYGPGQNLGKAQGLISHMSRCLIFGAPVHVYVPLDTIRDYLYVEDAGRDLAAGLLRLAREAPGSPDGRLHVTKLYASERETSIAGLIGVFRQIARRRLRIVSGLHAVAALQPRRLQFRSHVWAETPPARTQLVEGVGRLYRHQLRLFQRGQLPPPPPLPAR